MSRTQDLVLARLRLIALRWQGGSVATGAQPADAIEDVGEAGRLRADERACSASSPPAEPGAAPEPGGHGQDLPGGDPQPWPPDGMWIRLIGLVLGVVALGGVVLLVTSWPREQPPQVASDPHALAAGDPFSDPFAAASPAPSPSVTVHVVGEVRRPGVVELPAGSRVVDALAAAGGLRRGGELGGTNLARVLSDGERVEVGGSVAVGSASDGGSDGGAAGPLDLNTATAEQLDGLPGIGPVTAAKILTWRSAHGRFTVVDELAEVPGIGPKTLADLRPHVRV